MLGESNAQDTRCLTGALLVALPKHILPWFVICPSTMHLRLLHLLGWAHCASVAALPHHIVCNAMIFYEIVSLSGVVLVHQSCYEWKRCRNRLFLLSLMHTQHNHVVPQDTQVHTSHNHGQGLTYSHPFSLIQGVWGKKERWGSAMSDQGDGVNPCITPTIAWL